MHIYLLADLLTFFRLICSPFIFLVSSPTATFFIFGILLFSDYLDGVAARAFPDPYKSVRFYNKIPLITFDNLADISLFVGGLLWIITNKAWNSTDLIVSLVIGIIFVISRYLQDNPRTKESLKTYAATIAMWAFGALAVLELFIIVRATQNYILVGVILFVLVCVIALRGKNNINHTDKRA